jgi:lipopolysaccharide transport system ATP-binding protein
MNPDLSISTHELGKRYRIGALKEQTLSDTLAHPFRHIRRSWGDRANRPGVWALDRVSLDVRQGEALGIIGKNGAGKSTLLKILARITRPTTGHARIAGAVGSLLEVGTGFHPELTGRENVYLNGAILGMTKSYIDGCFDEIVAFAETDRFIDTPVKRYSSGMQMRLAFAVAAHLEPEILLVDEVLAVGDAQFQRKCLGKMTEVAHQGRTVLFVSHNMGSIARLCERAIWIDDGSIREDGNAREVVRRYLSTGAEHEGHREWVETEAPGGGSLRLLNLSIRQRGEVTSSVQIDEPFAIEIQTEVATDTTREIAIALQIVSVNGEVVLHSSEVMEANIQQRSRGKWRTVCSLPAYALNHGSYNISLGADEPNVMMVFAVENALSFTVHGDSSGMARYSPGTWKGYLGPGLPKWSVESESDADQSK